MARNIADVRSSDLGLLINYRIPKSAMMIKSHLTLPVYQMSNFTLCPQPHIFDIISIFRHE